MPIYRKGNRYLVSLGSRNDRYRQTFATEEEAKADEARELARRATLPKAVRGEGTGTISPLKSRKTLQEAYDLTFRLEWKGGKSEKTMTLNGGNVLKALGADTLLSDITTETITEMVLEFEDLGNSGSTVNRKLSLLSMVLKTAVNHNWLLSVPRMIRRKEGKHRIRWMNTEEEGNVLVACQHLGLNCLHDFIIVAVDTGFRRAELLGLSAPDFQEGMIHLYAGQTKNGDARAIPATSRVARILHRRRMNLTTFEGLTVSSLRHQWATLRAYMGMEEDPQFIVHMLRHTCASRLVQRGVPLASVQHWMGHKNINTTLRYAHLAPENLMQARNALEAAPTQPTAFESVERDTFFNYGEATTA